MKKTTIKLFMFFGMLVGLTGFKQTEKHIALPKWALGPFERPTNINPLITPLQTKFYCSLAQDTIRWENGNTFNPAAVIKNDTIYILYRAEDKSGKGIGQNTSRIGLAQSIDGVHLVNRLKSPVLYPTNDSQVKMEWPGGCEDPRVTMTKDSTYLILYTQWNRKVPRLAAALSKDLIHWKKYGPVFKKAYNGKFADRFSKSASVVTTLKKDRLIMTKINGKYLMYWGEKHVFAATSTDLVNWNPLVDKNQNLIPLASPRQGYFDSDLTECGPPAILTKDGIILIYNGKNNTGNKGDTTYTANAYCAGQMLFDRNNPYRLISRLNKPFLIPKESFEESGQYPSGTVFVEGLVYKNQKWFLYYGCADSRVAVAVYNREGH
jgi:predicted GH43/DUF377 family glycosyl hydrolase